MMKSFFRVAGVAQFSLSFVLSLFLSGVVEAQSEMRVEGRLESTHSELTNTELSPTGGTLTLEQAMEEGLARSPQIQKLRAVVEEYSWKKSEVLSTGFMPKLSVSGNQYFIPHYTQTLIAGFAPTPLGFLGFYPNTTVSLDLSIPIFDGLTNVKNLQGSMLNAEAAQKDLSWSEFQLKKDIELAFYQSLAALELNQVYTENVKTMEDHLRQVRVQNQGGSATKYDVLRVEVQLSDAQVDEVDSVDNVTMTRKKLTQLMGLNTDPRSLQGALPVPDVAQVKDLKSSDVISHRDDLQALSLRAEAAEKFHSAHKSWFVPTLTFGGQYLFYDLQQVNLATSSVENTGNFHTAYNLLASLRWNIFDGGVSIARANQAAYQEVEAVKAVEAARIQIPYDFEYWKRRYISNSRRYQAKRLDITRSQESVRLAKEEERAGTRTSTETLDAELDLFRARAGAVTSQVNAVEAKVQLERVLGKSLL